MSDQKGSAARDGAFQHVLAVVDDSGDGRHAAAFAVVVADQFGGAVTTRSVTESKARHRRAATSGRVGGAWGTTACTVSGPTFGARNRELAGQIAQAARAGGADVIVLGMDRHRLARHRLAPSLRSLVAEASDVAVLQAPPSTGRAESDVTSHGRSAVEGSRATATGTVHKGRYAGV